MTADDLLNMGDGVHGITVVQQHQMIGNWWQSHCSCGFFASDLHGSREAAEQAGDIHVRKCSADPVNDGRQDGVAVADELRMRIEAAIGPIASWVEVDYASLSTGADLVTDLVDAVLLALGSEPQDEGDLGEQMRHRELGVYRLFWYSGGCSVAAVGMCKDGSRWYAPANWTAGDPGAVVSTDWSPVKSAELIESYQASRRKRPRREGL